MYSVFGIMVNNFFLPVFGIAPLIYGLIYENNFVSKILKTPLFTLLGKSSYVFYLIHLGVFATFLMEHLHNFILSFIFLNIISIALYWYVEKPLNILIKKEFKHLFLINIKNKTFYIWSFLNHSILLDKLSPII